MATKAVLKALEQVFGAEVEGRLPFQSKARIYTDMQVDGLVEPMSRTFGTRPSAVVVEGWQLTHRGRLIYSSSCDAA